MKPGEPQRPGWRGPDVRQGSGERIDCTRCDEDGMLLLLSNPRENSWYVESDRVNPDGRQGHQSSGLGKADRLHEARRRWYAVIAVEPEGEQLVRGIRPSKP